MFTDRLTIAKMTVLLLWSTDSMQYFLEPWEAFCRNSEADSKIHMELKGMQNNQNNLVKNKPGRLNSPLQNLLQRNNKTVWVLAQG